MIPFALAAAAAHAMPPSGTPAAPASPATAPGQTMSVAQALARMGFSPAGIAILQQPLETPQTRDATVDGLRAANAAIAAAAAKSPFDFAAFDKALRDRQAIRADVENRRVAAQMDLIRRLSPADRVLFARTLIPHPAAPIPAHTPQTPTAPPH